MLLKLFQRTAVTLSFTGDLSIEISITGCLGLLSTTHAAVRSILDVTSDTQRFGLLDGEAPEVDTLDYSNIRTKEEMRCCQDVIPSPSTLKLICDVFCQFDFVEA